MAVYAQVIDGIVELTGGKNEGLPLPEYYLKKNPNAICIDITDMEDRPNVGDRYEDGIFISYKKWLEDNAPVMPVKQEQPPGLSDSDVIMLALIDLYEMGAKK